MSRPSDSRAGLASAQAQPHLLPSSSKAAAMQQQLHTQHPQSGLHPTNGASGMSQKGYQLPAQTRRAVALHAPPQGLITASASEAAMSVTSSTVGKDGHGQATTGTSKTRKIRMNKTGQKRTQLTKAQHKEILHLCSQPGARKKDIAVQFNVVKSTISGICKHYRMNGGFIDGPENSIKARPPLGADILDEPLMSWFRQRRKDVKKNPDNPAATITEGLICEEARRLAKLPENAQELKEGWVPNRNWVRRFNVRHNIYLVPMDDKATPRSAGKTA